MCDPFLLGDADSEGFAGRIDETCSVLVFSSEIGAGVSCAFCMMSSAFESKEFGAGVAICDGTKNGIFFVEGPPSVNSEIASGTSSAGAPDRKFATSRSVCSDPRCSVFTSGAFGSLSCTAARISTRLIESIPRSASSDMSKFNISTG